MTASRIMRLRTSSTVEEGTVGILFLVSALRCQITHMLRYITQTCANAIGLFGGRYKLPGYCSGSCVKCPQIIDRGQQDLAAPRPGGNRDHIEQNRGLIHEDGIVFPAPECRHSAPDVTGQRLD